MLTIPQQQIINSGLLSTGFNCVLQMPTGSGKTWLAEYVRIPGESGHGSDGKAATVPTRIRPPFRSNPASVI